MTRYIALTEFSRQRFVAAGMQAERISVKPNFIDPDPALAREAVATPSSSAAWPRKKASRPCSRLGRCSPAGCD